MVKRPYIDIYRFRALGYRLFAINSIYHSDRHPIESIYIYISLVASYRPLHTFAQKPYTPCWTLSLGSGYIRCRWGRYFDHCMQTKQLNRMELNRIEIESNGNAFGPLHKMNAACCQVHRNTICIWPLRPRELPLGIFVCRCASISYPQDTSKPCMIDGTHSIHTHTLSLSLTHTHIRARETQTWAMLQLSSRWRWLRLSQMPAAKAKGFIYPVLASRLIRGISANGIIRVATLECWARSL